MIKKCCCCGIKHPEVDFSGIHNCPNPLCTISGTANLRSNYKTRKETNDGYVVDVEECIIEGIKQTIERHDLDILDCAIEKLIGYWIPLLKKEWKTQEALGEEEK